MKSDVATAPGKLHQVEEQLTAKREKLKTLEFVINQRIATLQKEIEADSSGQLRRAIMRDSLRMEAACH
jgi:stress response protein YsnF